MRTKQGSKLAGVGALVLTVAATAPPALAKSLTQKEWRKQATAICENFGTELGALDAELLVDYVTPTPEQAAVFVGRAVPVFEEAIAAIDALDEPKALSPTVNRLVRTATKELAGVRDNPSILIETDGSNVLPKTHRISKALRITCLDG
jgi:hypothetical protein